MPIDYTYVAEALLEDGGRGQWQWCGPWRQAVTGPAGDLLRASTEEVRIAAAALGADLTEVSDLRVVDMVIWSAEERRRRQQQTENLARRVECTTTALKVVSASSELRQIGMHVLVLKTRLVFGGAPSTNGGCRQSIEALIDVNRF